jgi:uncharacterized membrane protein YhiD involved in acid resistance
VTARMRVPRSHHALAILTFISVVLAAAAAPAVQAQETLQPATAPSPGGWPDGLTAGVREALLRLPLAALLGTLLALRPKRRGTPRRQPEVVETQIILSVVGAIIMLVVGSSLARAFGIVGVASLIRYRSKIDDPKDAVVMLAALAVGLASGVGLYGLGVLSTAMLVVALWIIESFEPKSVKYFDLTVRAGPDTDAMRPRIEATLKRFRLRFELRAVADDEATYFVKVPLEVHTDRVTDAILQLDAKGHASVEWDEKKKK